MKCFKVLYLITLALLPERSTSQHTLFGDWEKGVEVQLDFHLMRTINWQSEQQVTSLPTGLSIYREFYSYDNIDRTGGIQWGFHAQHFCLKREDLDTVKSMGIPALGASLLWVVGFHTDYLFESSNFWYVGLDCHYLIGYREKSKSPSGVEKRPFQWHNASLSNLQPGLFGGVNIGWVGSFKLSVLLLDLYRNSNGFARNRFQPTLKFTYSFRLTRMAMFVQWLTWL